MSRAIALRMIKRRARQAGLPRANFASLAGSIASPRTRGRASERSVR